MVAVATVAAAWAGCGGDDNNSSSGNNQGGDNTSATATGTGTATGTATGTGTGTGPGPVTSSSSGGNLPDCKDALADDFSLLEECEVCLADSCCTEVSECAAADNCSVCITGAEECSDDAVDAAQTLVGCAQDNCEAECFDAPPPPPTFAIDCNAPADSPSMGACVPVMPNGQFKCNAVTNAPCNTAGGQACDVNGMGVQCWDPPNTQKLCDTCGNTFCMGGYTCVGDVDGTNKCAKYCCTDADCSGKCDTSVYGFPFGICVEGGAGGAGGGGGMGGMGGAGGAGGGGMGGMGGMGGAGGGMGGAGMGGAGGAGGN